MHLVLTVTNILLFVFGYYMGINSERNKEIAHIDYATEQMKKFEPESNSYLVLQSWSNFIKTGKSRIPVIESNRSTIPTIR